MRALVSLLVAFGAAARANEARAADRLRPACGSRNSLEKRDAEYPTCVDETPPAPRQP